MPCNCRITTAFLGLLLIGCESPTRPEEKSTFGVVIAPASLEVSAPGDVRVAVQILRDGDLVNSGDTLPKVLTTTGPFAADWDANNRSYYRNLVIASTGAGAGSVIVAVGDAADTIDMTATAISFRTVSATTGFACGIAVDDRVWCWGDNTTGQLGVETPGDCVGGACQYGGGRRNISPLPLPTTASFERISTGGGACSISFAGPAVCGRTCAVASSGVPTCWGSGFSLSEPLSTAGTFKSLDVSPSAPVTVSLQSCGLGVDDHAYCVGKSSATPGGAATEVGGGLTYKALSAYRTHTCGVDFGGDVYCWGANAKGQLGIGTADASDHPSPERVSTMVKFTSVETADEATCGLAVDGTIYCWGRGYSASGANPPASCPGTTTPCQLVPRLVEASGTYASISMSQTARTLCGLTSAGAVQCWALFNGSPTTISLPQPLTSISVGAPGFNQYFIAQGCGVSTTHVAWCWNGASAWKVGQ